MKTRAFWLVAIIFIALSCGDLNRDNVLDPKNPNSQANQIVLVELFVNDNTGFSYCKTAIAALEELSENENYRHKILLLEYHIEKNELADSFSMPECYDRYFSYVPVQAERGIPDAFFNGKIERVQGASMEMVKDRYDSVLSDLTDKKSYFRFEVEMANTGNSVTVLVKVIRLGTKRKENVNVVVVLYEDLGTPLQRHVVRKIMPFQIINSISPGEAQSFSFSSQLTGDQNMANIHAAVLVQDRNETTMEVYQAAQF